MTGFKLKSLVPGMFTKKSAESGIGWINRSRVADKRDQKDCRMSTLSTRSRFLEGG